MKRTGSKASRTGAWAHGKNVEERGAQASGAVEASREVKASRAVEVSRAVEALKEVERASGDAAPRFFVPVRRCESFMSLSVKLISLIHHTAQDDARRKRSGVKASSRG